jgi:hypothetical protein
MNPKIGTYAPEGAIYPSETISGKPYSRTEYDPPPTIVHGLLDGHFALGEIWLPRDFDVNAAVAALNAELQGGSAPVIVEVVNDATGETVEVPELPEDQG